MFEFNSLLDISIDQVFQPEFVRTTKFCKISITVCNSWGRKSMYSVLRQKWKINSFWKNVTQTNETYNVCFHLICEYFFMFFPTYRISYRILKYLCPISSPTDATSNLFISAFTCSEERKTKIYDLLTLYSRLLSHDPVEVDKPFSCDVITISFWIFSSLDERHKWKDAWKKL